MIGLDTFWGSFGGLVIAIVLGLIYVRTQLTKHTAQIETLQSQRKSDKVQIDKDNAAQDEKVKDVEARLLLDIERMRTESQNRQTELKQDIQALRKELKQDFQRIYDILTTK